MEKIIRYIAEQNKYFDPRDSLSILIDLTLRNANEELSEEDLSFVQAARGSGLYNPEDQRKEADIK